MSNDQRTASPWYLLAGDADPEGGVDYAVMGADGATVAEGMSRADGLLLAVAPELLKVAELVVKSHKTAETGDQHTAGMQLGCAHDLAAGVLSKLGAQG
jgi:hypothetical protein